MILQNKKAQVRGGLLFGIMIGVLLYFWSVYVFEALKTPIVDAQVAMNCSAPASDGIAVLCSLFDFSLPVFIIFVLVFAVLGEVIDKHVL